MFSSPKVTNQQYQEGMGGGGYNSSSSLSPEDYKFVMFLIKDSVKKNLRPDSNGSVNSDELQNEFAKQHPIIGDLYHPSFVHGVVKALVLLQSFDMHYDYYDFYAIFEGIRFRDETDNMNTRRKRTPRKYRRNTDPENAVEMFESNVELDEKAKMRVSVLKKLHAKLDIEEDFKTVMDKLCETNGLTFEEHINSKSGKNYQYIIGLALTDDGRELLEHDKADKKPCTKVQQ